MDPISIASSIISTAGFAIQLANSLHKIADTYRNINTEVQDFYCQLASLKSVLQDVEVYGRSLEDIDEHPNTHCQALFGVLESTRTTLESVQSELARNENQIGDRNRWLVKWADHKYGISACTYALRTSLTIINPPRPHTLKSPTYTESMRTEKLSMRSERTWQRLVLALSFYGNNDSSSDPELESSIDSASKTLAEELSSVYNRGDAKECSWATGDSAYDLGRVEHNPKETSLIKSEVYGTPELSKDSDSVYHRDCDVCSRYLDDETKKGRCVLSEEHSFRDPKPSHASWNKARGNAFQCKMEHVEWRQDNLRDHKCNLAGSATPRSRPYSWALDVFAMGCAAASAAVLYHFDHERYLYDGRPYNQMSSTGSFFPDPTGMLTRVTPAAAIVSGIGVYSAAVGCRYHWHMHERHQDKWLVGGGTLGAVLGFGVGLDPQGVVFQVLPGLILVALLVGTWVWNNSWTYDTKSHSGLTGGEV